MKGRFDFLILHLLSKEEMYGFQIIKRFAENCAEDEFELKTGTLYPLLAAMEDRGFLSSRTASLSGRERKFYRTTEQGKEYFLQRRGSSYMAHAQQSFQIRAPLQNLKTFPHLFHRFLLPYRHADFL